MKLADAIKTTSAHDLADLTAFVVSECEMVTQDTDGKMVDINNDDVVRAIKAWAYMNLNDGKQGD
ncbi:hypothetical protein [uncultured Tateyamaria sp.]|uniref:hypothetical protein n=1 Tax=uncultured Tateyamaria sp. TaxID=455651 RepID=UPI00262CDE65|nr:hypothetical protein [uncultured Tateyamaria sp.]